MEPQEVERRVRALKERTTDTIKEHIRLRGYSEEILCDRLGLLPTGVKIAMGSTWSLNRCARYAMLLGLQIDVRITDL